MSISRPINVKRGMRSVDWPGLGHMAENEVSPPTLRAGAGCCPSEEQVAVQRRETDPQADDKICPFQEAQVFLLQRYLFPRLMPRLDLLAHKVFPSLGLLVLLQQQQCWLTPSTYLLCARRMFLLRYSSQLHTKLLISLPTFHRWGNESTEK